MAGDFSRNSINKSAGYAGVLMQQGRVQLDSDWNEQLALAGHRTQTETRDVIGCCGTPKGENGFKIEVTPDGVDFFIHPGRFYAGGLLCENSPDWVELSFRAELPLQGRLGPRILFRNFRRAVLQSSWMDGRPLVPGNWVEMKATGKTGTLRTRVVSIADDLSVIFSDSIADYESAGQVFIRRAPTYLTQPFYPVPDTGGAADSPLSSPAGGGLELPDGKYLVYLEAWQREVNALEDPHLREVALGGPDTAERLQTVWQVKLLKVTEDMDLPPEGEHRPCQENLPEWTQLLASKRTTGQMNARSTPPTPDSNPCILPPSAGFQGLQNQLYRVEIFQTSDTLAGATFVWSRDNAMVETGIVSVDTANTNVITVQDLGKDDLHSFEVNDWVEVVDRDSELNGSPRFLARIVAPAPDQSTKKITLSAPLPNPGAVNSQGTDVFRLRRWDMTGSTVTEEGLPATAGWLPLEAGVEVSFGEGSYVSRSFWLVPARTATADVEWPPFQIPNTQPVPQPPLGEFHYFCRLALIESVYGKWTAGDCRLQFPPLTNICADDVCYHGTCDALKDAETVKDALDRLCEDANLRFHKKRLHGWGIVCDLQVKCAGDESGSSVIVNKGYAIDCEGKDILLSQPVTFDVLSHIRTASGIADGAYSLYFDTLDNNNLRVEPYTPPANKITDALAGTFWPEYYAQYIQPLIDLWQELGAAPANAIVKDRQKILSSLTNLLVQLVSSQTGSGVYISQAEHDWLARFYDLLKTTLRDNAFCGMWSNAPAVPNYPASIGGIGTGFGDGFKTRLRVNQLGTLAAALGNDNTIHVYEIQDHVPVLTQILTFPGDSTFVVHDAGFSAEGDTLYAIATSAGNSSFATTRLSTISWTQALLPGVALASLVVQPGLFVATAVGQGLYTFGIDTAGVITPTLALAFNAIGQLFSPVTGTLFATTNSASAVTNVFNQVVCFTHTTSGFARNGSGLLPNQMLGTPNDDLTVRRSTVNQNVQWRVYVTANPPAAGSDKFLLVNYASGPNSDFGPWAQVDLGENTTVRLAYHLRLDELMLTFEGSNRISALTETFTTTGGAPVRSLSLSNAFAAEVSPVSFVASDRGEALLALNAISNTITVIPYARPPWTPTEFAALGEYRREMLSAYTALVGVFIQYLKDAFCELLLLKCRDCQDEVDQPVYLAGITIRNGRVYKICNLTQRRYVKTFPGVEYWLSIVPILPIVELAVREFCCLTFTDFFSRLNVPQSSAANLTSIPSASSAYSAVGQLKTIKFSTLTTAIQSRLSPTVGIGSDYVKALFNKSAVAPTPAPSVAANAVTGQPLPQAQRTLEQQGVVFNVKQYDANNVGANIVRSARAPAQIPAGSSVTLYTDSAGSVKAFEIVPAQIQDLQIQVKSVEQTQSAVQTALSTAPSLQTDVAALKIQLTALQTTHQQELAKRDAQIAQLTASTQQIQTALSDVKTQVLRTGIVPPKG